ncbi:MAG: 1-deoxy-D-xylulose-5-phosphate reductoisomerase [Syntrophomonadaceae bacterium]|nr:1-deoxy-D-xylulose-5-phosphate reductoisomerase [Syntrophomonadaceae bacterium]
MQAKKKIILLGSTGSIGQQTLEVVRAHSDHLEVVGLAAGSNFTLLLQQYRQFSPPLVALADIEAAQIAASVLENQPVKVLSGPGGLLDLLELPQIDLVVNAMSGFAGLPPTLKALQRGIPVAMANKEPLVAAGPLIMAESRRHRAPVLPIDSEPSAIFQCMREEGRFLNKIIITASGGPFRGWTREQLATVNPELALRHPNWSMGPKITVDSATLMNKGLEVIEAHQLFGVDYAQIEVVIHPQSMVHSLVEFRDGSLLAHLGQPDMRIPIQYALSYPERWGGPWPHLNLAQVGELTFQEPDYSNFPCLELAYGAGQIGGSMPAVLSAADEEAVNLFLRKEIGFLDIPRLVEGALGQHQKIDHPDLDTLLAVDQWARCWVREHR